jgi:eukaryotic-like serine/threonine-protein kinase
MTRADAEAMLKEWRTMVPGHVLEQVLGVGGTACVFLAKQQSLGRKVAVKVLHWSGAGSEELQSLLKREGRGIAGLSHPNIIHVYDFGVVEERAYLVLEHVDAPSLAEVLAEGPLPAEDAASRFEAVQCAGG